MALAPPVAARLVPVLLGMLAAAVPAAGQVPAASDRPVTFTRDIAPIVVARCVGCHRPAGPAPFSLLTFDDARRRARLMAQVTADRYMPPWKPHEESGPFVGDRRLTDEEIRLFARWVEDGAGEGPADARPPVRPSVSGWQLGEPDLIVSLPPFDAPADGGDLFRNFVVSTGVDVERYVRGIEIRPGNRAVHHVTVRVDPTRNSRELDEDDPAPGYAGVIPFSAEHPAGHLVGWTPGQVASFLPSGWSWRLAPASDLVVQVHLQPTGKPQRVQPTIGLFFTDEAPQRLPIVLRLGSQDIRIPAGAADYATTDSFVLPADVELHSIQPHAHYRARDVRASAVLPDGSRRPLLTIEDWDFNWQDAYRFAAPPLLPAGTRLEVRFVYDNSSANPRNPAIPPEPVIWGPRSVDEMGDVLLQLMPRGRGSYEPLAAAVRRKMLEQDVDGLELQVNAHLADTTLRTDLADAYMQLGRPDRAAGHFEAVAVIEPRSAPAHYNHGVALQQLGVAERAAAAYTRALQLDPAYAQPHRNLGIIFVTAGRHAEALAHLETAARLYGAAGRFAEAIQAASAALQVAVTIADATARQRLEQQLVRFRGAAGERAN